MNTAISPSVQQFFAEFNRASAALDIPAILSEFAEEFLYAGAKGTQVIRKEQFAALVAKQKEMFDAFGQVSSDTVPVEEYPLDDAYTVVKAKVTMIFRKDGKDVEIVQQVSYMLRMGDTPTICVYANAHDVMRLLSDAGLAKA
jgi:ketosteroid isomerase-like protein